MGLILQPKIFVALLIAAIALVTKSGEYAWNHYRFTPDGALVADSSSHLSFALDDSYASGQDMIVSISNSSSASYTVTLPDESCNLELYDQSGRIILQDYHQEAGSYTVVSILPEDTTNLCVLKLRECTARSLTTCRGTRALEAGIYTVLGKFYGRDGLETVISREFRISP